MMTESFTVELARGLHSVDQMLQLVSTLFLFFRGIEPSESMEILLGASIDYAGRYR